MEVIVYMDFCSLSHVVVYSLDKFCMKNIRVCYNGLSHLARNVYAMHRRGRVIVTMEQIVVYAITDSL